MEKHQAIRNFKFNVSSECDLICAQKNPPKNHESGHLTISSLDNAHTRHAL